MQAREITSVEENGQNGQLSTKQCCPWYFSLVQIRTRGFLRPEMRPEAFRRCLRYVTMHSASKRVIRRQSSIVKYRKNNRYRQQCRTSTCTRDKMSDLRSRNYVCSEIWKGKSSHFGGDLFLFNVPLLEGSSRKSQTEGGVAV